MNISKTIVCLSFLFLFSNSRAAEQLFIKNQTPHKLFVELWNTGRVGSILLESQTSTDISYVGNYVDLGRQSDLKEYSIKLVLVSRNNKIVYEHTPLSIKALEENCIVATSINGDISIHLTAATQDMTTQAQRNLNMMPVLNTPFIWGGATAGKYFD
jgi:hypothetical protein